MWAGTSQSNIYKMSVGDLKAQLVTTCHYDCINNIIFPLYASALGFLLSYKCKKNFRFITTCKSRVVHHTYKTAKI